MVFPRLCAAMTVPNADVQCERKKGQDKEVSLISVLVT
ncbi:hypothetical protein C1A50_0400 [Paenibacillus polymyxa]|nr:hypothetical protein C1A50_0400 [Paenibacillus polymyxa]